MRKLGSTVLPVLAGLVMLGAAHTASAELVLPTGVSDAFTELAGIIAAVLGFIVTVLVAWRGGLKILSMVKAGIAKA